MSWFSGFGSGSVTTDKVGMTSMDESTQHVDVPGTEKKEPSALSKFAKQAGEELVKGGRGGGTGGSGTGSGGSGSTLSAKRPIGEHPEAPKQDPADTPARAGFARLAEVGSRQRNYGTP